MRTHRSQCRALARLAALLLVVLGSACAEKGAPRIDFTAEKNPPRGYLVYCSRTPELCGDVRNELVWLTAARWNELVTVNDSVNTQTLSITDERGFGVVDYWTVAAGAGDCEDIALAKRAALVKRGWPKSALLLAVTETRSRSARPAPAGSGRHVVLLAFTDKGTFVLDSNRRNIVDWEKSRYRFLSVESPGNPLLWQAVERAR
jgi:predicted transglutaminase-like cysteine proteinase